MFKEFKVVCIGVIINNLFTLKQYLLTAYYILYITLGSLFIPHNSPIR